MNRHRLSQTLLYTAHRAFVQRQQARGISSWLKSRRTGVVVVPQQSAYVVERFGKFEKELKPGIHLVWPFIETVEYVRSLKEEAIVIPDQSVITRDNVTIALDGVLYIKVVDPVKASYGVENPLFAVSQMAQTTVRSEMGKLTLDETFLERERLNASINKAINEASANWGIECVRYEIRDINMPPSIRQAMEKQAEAERQKRAEILQSEGEQQAAINLAEGRKRSSVLQAEGEAESYRLRARGTSDGLRILSEALSAEGSQKAATLQIADQYVQAFANMAHKGSTMIVPSSVNDPSAVLAKAFGVYNGVKNTVSNTFEQGEAKATSTSNC